ncbi:hemolysin family protein [Bacteroides propionicifaciens]|uniref:hemolysin family protein n=1 Tax=Bacteroides propionicifaciens TaxID=392838 RepID=UPI00046ABC4E|nr:hemolysin family protein [Bacteroides propionicifaciens]
MLTIFLLILTMLFSAFFSGVEIAFVSVDKLRFEMERGLGINSKILSVFFKHPNNFISTMLVGNNIALVIYGILMAVVLDQLFLDALVPNQFLKMLIQTVVSTFIILFTGEFIPKTLFKINPNLVLRILAFPVFVCYVILYPISLLASFLSYVLLRLLGVKVNSEVSKRAFTKVDLDYFVQTGIEHSESKEAIENEVQIFQNALDFSDIKIRDCIVPRTEVRALDVIATREELMNMFIETGLSKIIIYRDTIDKVVGYIHSSEMFRSKDDWQSRIQEAPIVPDTMSAHKLMKIFMSQKKTIAVVVDEFGGTAGIVSLEDLVEEIFGDIEDEHDILSLVSKKINDKEYILSSRLEIEKVNEKYDLELPESDEYLTIGGLILHFYQSFPKLNEVIVIDQYHFKILKVSTNKIELVRLNIIE